MADNNFSTDSLRIGNLKNAATESSEGDLVLRDTFVPQGIKLKDIAAANLTGKTDKVYGASAGSIVIFASGGLGNQADSGVTINDILTSITSSTTIQAISAKVDEIDSELQAISADIAHSFYDGTFTEADISGNAGNLTVMHNMDSLIPEVIIYDQNAKKIEPDGITADSNNQATLDLHSFEPINGTWRYSFRRSGYGNGVIISGGSGGGTVNFSFFQSDIIPSIADTYSLGTSAKPWKDIFVSGNTLYIGGSTVSVTSGSLAFNDETLVTQTQIAFITAGSVDLTPYATISLVGATSAATISYIQTLSSTPPDLSEYVTLSTLNGISSELSQSISSVSSRVDYISGNYATISLLSSTSAATISYIQTLSSTPPDLSGYASISLLSTTSGDLNTKIMDVSAAVTPSITNTLSNLNTSIIPATSGTLSLGSLARPFKDLYVTNSTIYFNNVPVTMSGNNLQVNGNQVVTSNDLSNYYTKTQVDTIVSSISSTGSTSSTTSGSYDLDRVKMLEDRVGVTILRQMITDASIYRNYNDGVGDDFRTTDLIDLAKTTFLYSPSGDCYFYVGTGTTMISGTALSNIVALSSTSGNVYTNSGAATTYISAGQGTFLFNGSNANGSAWYPFGSLVAGSFLQFDFAGSPKALNGINTQLFSGPSSGDNTKSWNVIASNNLTSWTTALTGYYLPSGMAPVLYSWPTIGEFRYWRIALNSNGTFGGTNVGEMWVTYATGISSSINKLISNPYPVSDVFNSAKMLFTMNPAGISTTNSISAAVSRDGGTTFSYGVVSNEGTFSGNTNIYAIDDVDFSAAPSGQNLTWKIETPANTFPSIYGAWFQWRQSSLSSSGSTTTLNHNDLLEKQGGTTNEYYHLTAAQSSNFFGRSDFAAVSGNIGGTKNDRQLLISFGDGINVIDTSTVGVALLPNISEAGTFNLARVVSSDYNGLAISGSATIDVWKSSFAAFPPISGGSITSGNYITLPGNTKNEDSTLSGWTKTFSKGDCFIVKMNTNTNCKKISVVLQYSPS
jgi:hypothetical protein